MKHTLNIQINTNAPLAISTGKNDGLIDNDILTDSMGFPYINQRRLKGVLKEAVIETLEICGNPNKVEVIKYVFGNKGANFDEVQSKIQISDAKIYNHSLHKKAATYRRMSLNFIKNHYSTTILQTAIDPMYKTAKKGSLRKIRAIKDVQKFSFSIGFDDEQLTSLIQLAILQWSFMGSSRNNGLGNVTLNIKDDKPDLDKLVRDVKSLKLGQIQRNTSKNIKPYDKDILGPLKLKIKLVDKVLISGGAVGDQNTIQSKTYIDGRTIWGTLATEYLKVYGNDNDFKYVFRDGEVTFGPAFINDSQPLSLHRQVDKKSKSLTLYNAFNPSALTLKPKGGYIELTSNLLIEPRMKAAFHFNRENYRRSGVSENGEIFYYDALDKDQEFYTQLEGKNNALLKKIADLIGDSTLRCRMGRSRDIEYGQVEISIQQNDASLNQQLDPSELKSFKFYCLSPCLISNESGYAEPTLTNVNQTLIDKGFDIKSIKMISSFTSFQSHSGVWRSMTSNEPCFNVGTAFQVELLSPLTIATIKSTLTECIGLNTHQGFGKVKVVANDISNYILPELSGEQNQWTDDEITKMEKSSLYIAYNNYSEELAIQIEGLDKADKSKIAINNHQISRIRHLINKFTSQELLKTEIDGQGYKPIAEIMNKLKWTVIYSDDYNHFMTYMNAFLDAKRLKNNTKNNSHDSE